MNVNDFLQHRAVSGRPVGAIDAVLLRQYDRHLAVHAATPRVTASEPAAAYTAAVAAPARACSASAERNAGLEALEYMRKELKLRCASLLSSSEQPLGTGAAEWADAEAAQAQAALSPAEERAIEEPPGPVDPLLASIRAYRKELQLRQLELRARAASEHTLREQPASGWYTLKSTGFHRQLHRLNRLDARARRGQASLLQTLASL